MGDGYVHVSSFKNGEIWSIFPNNLRHFHNTDKANNMHSLSFHRQGDSTGLGCIITLSRHGRTRPAQSLIPHAGTKPCSLLCHWLSACHSCVCVLGGELAQTALALPRECSCPQTSLLMRLMDSLFIKTVVGSSCTPAGVL